MWGSVRKFGLEHCDLPTMMWNVSLLLRPLTLDIDSRCKQPIPIIFYILTAVSGACYFYVYLISMVWFVFWRSPETGDVLAALIVFSLGIASEIGTIKLFYMFLYREKVRLIVDDFLACDSLVVPGSRFSNNLLRTLRGVKKRAIIFWMVIIVNGVVYIIMPIILPGRHSMEDCYIILGLEPMYESPNYEFAFLLMSIGVWVSCYLPANITAFLIVITGYIEAQMLALSEELLHLWDDAEQHHNQLKAKIHGSDAKTVLKKDTDIKYILNEYIKQRLTNIIRLHASNIKLLKQIEYIFKGALAFEFTLLVVGLIAELLGGLENTYLQVPFALMQVAMDCLTGQRVMDASMIFERAVYDCKWEKFDKSNMKIVLLMLQSSQKTMSLSAGGITVMSFSTMMSVIRSIYSTYTTLRSAIK